jgi:hypothetical protein
MKTKAIIEGLQVLLPFYNDQDGFHNGAEHDTFYAYATDTELPEAAVKWLIELGWFQPDVEYEDDFLPEHYDPSEGWVAYL